MMALLAAVTLAAAGLAFTGLRTFRAASSAATPALRLALTPLEELALGGGPDYPFGLSLAPDGRRLVFPAAKQGLTQLWVRDLTTGESQPLPGTEEGVLPFWAPDGRAIGFFANRRLRVITLEDAAVRDLADAPSPRGGAWHQGGDIIFAPEHEGPLYRRRGSTGAIDAFTTLDVAATEASHRLPAFVDRGRHVLFFVRAESATRQGIWIAPTDAPGNRKRLTGATTHGVAVGDGVLYSSDGALVAQRINLESQALSGRPILLGAPVGQGPQNQLFATTTDDVLIYGAPASSLRELRWVDRSGMALAVLGEPMDAWDLRISPDGASVVVTRVDPQLGTLDIWTYDGDRPVPRRISPAIDADETAAWARDGHRLAWVTGRRVVTLGGTLAALPEEALRTFEHSIRLSDWSPDQEWLVLSESRPVTHDDIWLLPLNAQDAPVAYAQSPFNEMHGVVSPDGRWMAYASDESGRFEIYVDSFPQPGTRARLTTGGGDHPRWSADGSELYFRRGSELHAVAISSGGVPEAVRSERVFDAGTEIRAYDVSADGQRFLLNVPTPDLAPQPLTVLVNVRSLLRFAP